MRDTRVCALTIGPGGDLVPFTGPEMIVGVGAWFVLYRDHDDSVVVFIGHVRHMGIDSGHLKLHSLFVAAKGVELHPWCGGKYMRGSGIERWFSTNFGEVPEPIRPKIAQIFGVAA